MDIVIFTKNNASLFMDFGGRSINKDSRKHQFSRYFFHRYTIVFFEDVKKHDLSACIFDCQIGRKYTIKCDHHEFLNINELVNNTPKMLYQIYFLMNIPLVEFN